ncbi:AAWKG family protein [Streptomyces sp. NPDC002809]|uniref:AAWKG family protein n=1 Tax=Streptomyces sp. NPDC002809 TaxID=3154433 RepID=UPI0033276175
MTTPSPALWESIVKQLTGFDGGTREDVGGIKGKDSGGGSDNPSKDEQTAGDTRWMTPTITRINGTPPTGGAPAPGRAERIIQFYGADDGPGSDSRIDTYQVSITFPWLKTGMDWDWGKDGVASAFDWGYGMALEQLSTKFDTVGFTYGSRSVGAEAGLNLKSFVQTSMAFDRVRDFFDSRSRTLEQWHLDLGEENAALRGKAASVFRILIDGLNTGYKNFAHDLDPVDQVQVSPSHSAYTATTGIGNNLISAEKALHDCATTLRLAWQDWTSQPGQEWLPTAVLLRVLDRVAEWVNANNIGRMDGSGLNWVRQAGYQVSMPPYGDLRQVQAWQNIADAAYKEWTANIGVKLDAPATAAAATLNKALSAAGKGRTAFIFRPGVTSLADATAKEEAEKEKEDLRKEQEEAKKESEALKDQLAGGAGAGDQSPLDPNGVGDAGIGDVGAGPEGDTVTNPSVDSAQLPAGLGLNSLSGSGTSGSGLAGTGGTTYNADGSTTVRKADGSSVTTYPDGSQVTTPPGGTPLLPLNTGGLTGGATGTPVSALRTVKGPDSSTTSYNADGSRTTTHKDGTSTTVDRDGTVTTVNPDGSRTVLNKDGSETVTYQDGTRTTIKPDGSTVTQYPDGSRTSTTPDGMLTTTDAQGHSTTTHPGPGQTVQNPDGSRTAFGEDGSAVTTYEDGTRTSVSADGTVTTVDPDGTRTVAHLGKGTSTVTYADGSVATVGSDGSVTTAYKDGSTTKLGADGTFTSTDAQGHKTTEHLNTLGGNAGAQTTYRADGSSVTTYPDGTVDRQLKDGGHEISYPDGRTVTTDANGVTTGTRSALLDLNSGSTGGSTGLPSSLYDYYDYPDDGEQVSPLSGAGSRGSGDAGGSATPLAANPLGAQGLNPMGTAGTAASGAGTAAERLRTGTLETNGARTRSAQLAAEEASLARRPATSSSGGTPMMPPMGGAGGMSGGTQSDERERHTWVSEDEDVWGTDEGGVAGVIGR